MFGVFKGWLPAKPYGFISPSDGSSDLFVHESALTPNHVLRAHDTVEFDCSDTPRGRSATNVSRCQETSSPTDERPVVQIVSKLHGRSSAEAVDPLHDEVEDTDSASVSRKLLKEIATWKREAKAENNDQYFWNVKEVAQIQAGDKYFVIGRKGSGKTAICEHFNQMRTHDVFSDKLSFKNFPFNELYAHKNQKFTTPNQYITLWKYLIYSSVCRMMLKNEAVDSDLRTELGKLYGDELSLSRRIGKWVAKEFGFSLFGISAKVAKDQHVNQGDWTAYVDYLEDILLSHAGDATYFVLFDELDEDYRDVIQAEQYQQYTALITSLFKAVQDVRTTLGANPALRVFPVVFLRDDIYEIVQDNDKNKWGDFRVDLNWDIAKIKKVIAFRISRALNPTGNSLDFEDAWRRVFGTGLIGIGSGAKRKTSTFDYIAQSTLLRPRDFVAYLQNCAHDADENNQFITPDVVKRVDKAFSNYLREELTDELFAILPDVVNIFDAISQLRKWNFSIAELEITYGQQIERGFIKEKNVKFVLQTLYLFSVIGNVTSYNRPVFRYQNREARLNFNERVAVHRGLFKALQIL
jgi:cold shock CspA family protein/energy-coupling factor transporter ATP-binding protein EcfA2